MARGLISLDGFVPALSVTYPLGIYLKETFSHLTSSCILYTYK
jgi:hypothetical protein